MVITARYAGRCSSCGGQFKGGDHIEWDKDMRTARHLQCPQHAQHVGRGRPALSPGEPSVTMAWLRVPLSLSTALRRINRSVIREWLGRLVQERQEQAGSDSGAGPETKQGPG